MSEGWKDGVSRRPLLAVLGAVVGLGVAGGAVYEVSRLLGPRAPGVLGDLLFGLGDRKDAVLIGKAVLAGDRAASADKAGSLRRALGQKPLAEVLVQDAVQGRIVETQGWVLPQTLAELCALAAKAS
jgi:hypothetical protein